MVINGPIWWKARCPLTLAAIAMAATMVACASADQAPLEERARSIDKSLICAVCPGETIEQAQVELARQMRAVVREKLAVGWTRDQILQFFVDRYGEGVLAAPAKSGFNLIAWVVPFAAVGGGAVILLLVIRAMRRGREMLEDQVDLPERELEPYLSRVDQELGLPQEGSHEPGERG